MTICNLIAILLLSGKVFKLVSNYMEQRKQGKNPVFHRSMMPEIEKDIECWD
jgi:AGCS family alanine or glycine:cation symporter